MSYVLIVTTECSISGSSSGTFPLLSMQKFDALDAAQKAKDAIDRRLNGGRSYPIVRFDLIEDFANEP